jgi:ATP-dependent helicase HrpB
MTSPSTPTALPIEAVLPQLRGALARHNRCLLVAQPGAGKTTRVPLDLLQADASGRSRWLLLEPRRVAARLAAGYMAEQLGETLGGTVGYRVRGESRVGPATRLEVVTQGILTRMLQDDPALSGVQGIIFDEFHERSLDADLGLALALDVQQGLRDDLQLLIMSATLDVGALLQVLGEDTPVIDCPGRVWPVSTQHRSPPLREYAERQQAAVVREALAAHEGDVLVFLPGQAEIRRLQRELEGSIPGHVELYPLHGQLTLAQQQAVLRRQANTNSRRVILSTAIAESSLTVPGVRIVVDAGLERVPVFQPRSGLSLLDTRRVNRASADQRRGRAGREAPGVCYRLWAEETMLAPHREPQMLQADLAGLLFELLRWGVQDPAALSWVSPPPAPALESARALLRTLGLLEPDGSLSRSGRACGRWPTHPRLAVLLQEAERLSALPLACWLVAWLDEDIGGQDIDLAVLFAALENGAHANVDERWKRAARQWAARAGCSLEIATTDALPLLLARAWPDRLAQNQRQSSDQGRARFKLVSGGQALLPETHALARADFLLAVELDGDASGARIFHAVAISPAQVAQCFPESTTWRADVRWDASSGRMLAEEVRGIGALVLERRPLRDVPPQVLRQGLLEALRQRGSLAWSDDDRQLLGRLRLLQRTLGSPWPPLSDDDLLATLEDWLEPHLEGLSRLEQVDRLPLGRLLLESLDWSLQQQLPQLAPTHLGVPSGNRIALDYTGPEPVLAVKLQELFGLQQTPTLVQGRVSVLLHLLSPARRPVQVTRDLANFWATGYFDVRKDLRGRYPRHPWPEDPLQAEPSARTKKRPEGK